jgi:hypothetical protein
VGQGLHVAIGGNATCTKSERRDHPRNNIVRRRRDFQDGSAEYEVDHHRRVRSGR